MRDNKLKLNDDKLHLIVIDTGCSKIKHEESRKWAEPLTNASENMVKSLNTRLGALKKICRLTTFKNSISKLTYLICLWDGCSYQFRKTLQVIQNKAARLVAKCDWSGSLREVFPTD